METTEHYLQFKCSCGTVHIPTEIQRWKLDMVSEKHASPAQIIIAIEELPNQEYGQHLQVVLGKESFAKDRNDGFFTRVRRASGDGGEWAGHYNMTLIEAAIDFQTRLHGTGQALAMLHNQIQEVKR